MRALLLIDEAPFPTNSGNRVVLTSEAREYLHAFTSVDVVVFARQRIAAPERAAIARMGDHSLVQIRDSLAKATLRAPLSPYQSSSRRLTTEAIAEVTSWGTPDVIIANHEWTLAAAQTLKAVFPRSKVVLRSHNDERRFMRDLAQAAVGARGVYARLESSRTSGTFIRRSASIADEIWTIANEDSAAYASVGAPIFTMPPIASSATTSSPAPIDQGAVQRGSSLGFLGALDIPHAVDGLKWFIAHVLPGIRKALPAASLIVAGRNASSSLAEWFAKQEGVTFIGEVSSPADLYSRVQVFVNPVFSGSGVNIKMLGPIAEDLPIVTTTVGGRGLDALGLDTYDEVESFTQACLELLQDFDKRAATASIAKRRMTEYSSTSFRDRVKARIRAWSLPAESAA